MACYITPHVVEMCNRFDPEEIEETDVLQKLEESAPGNPTKKRERAQVLAYTAQATIEMWEQRLADIRRLMECDLSKLETFATLVIEAKRAEAANLLRYVEAYQGVIRSGQYIAPADIDAAVEAAFTEMCEG